MIKTQILEMTVEPSAPSSTDYRGSREAGSQIVVVDLGDTQSPLRVNSLRKGEGELINRIDRIVGDLVQDGTLKSGAQTVVVVVREFTSFLSGAFGGEDEDVEDDDD
jgi:hypothetical protein